jgi:dihydrofolate reductase
MRISIIASIGKNLELGVNNTLIWPLKADLERFRHLTTNQYVLMGYNTFVSIGSPLKNRINLVISDMPLSIKGAYVFPDVKSAIAWAESEGCENLFVAGGGEIYRKTIPLATSFHITQIEEDCFNATIFFPMDWNKGLLKLNEEDFPDKSVKAKWEYWVRP